MPLLKPPPPAYPRNYRPIEDGDVAAAHRGLRLELRTTRDLRELRSAHALIDLFASAVICRAVDRELERRSVP